MRLHHSNITDNRKKEISEFLNQILNIGNGTINVIKDDENEDAIWIEIPNKYIINSDSNPIKTIYYLIYNDFIHNFHNIDYLRERAIVAPKNKTVDDINKYILSLVPNE